MAGHGDGGELFSDDDLDDLPNDALAELESNAIRSTQAFNQAAIKVPPSSDYGDDFEDEDLDDAVVIDESKSAAAVVRPLYRSNPGQNLLRESLHAERQDPRHQPGTNLVNRQRSSNQSLTASINSSSTRSTSQNVDSLAVDQGSQPAKGDPVETLQKQMREVPPSTVIV